MKNSGFLMRWLAERRRARQHAPAAAEEAERPAPAAGKADAQMGSPAAEKPPARAADPARVAALRRMGEDLHLFMRMAAMDMLRGEDGGFVMEIPGDSLRIPGARTLFEAYLTIEEHLCGDWTPVDGAIRDAWAETAIRMVLEPQAYRPLWEGLRRRIAVEMTSLAAHGYTSDASDRRSLKSFTFLCMHICDKVTDTLGDGNRT